MELAVPLNCNNQVRSYEAYALARSADAIGITLGVLTGTIGTYLGFTRIIYFIDVICMVYIFNILMNKLKAYKQNEQSINKIKIEIENIYKNSNTDSNIKWIFELVPLLSLIVPTIKSSFEKLSNGLTILKLFLCRFLLL